MLPFIFRGHDDPGFLAHALSLSPHGSALTWLPGNERSEDARYVCLIVVKDYHRMLRRSAESGEWHYSALEPAILGDVRAGRALLVFDLCNEGPAYDAEIFSELYAWIETNHLPAGRCIWLAQNRLAGASARVHAGARAHLVQFEFYDYFIKIMAWIFSPSSPGNALGAEPDVYIERLFDADCKDKLLLCLNATPRLPRVLTVAALLHYGLLPKALVSFPGMRYVKAGASLTEVIEFLANNPSLEYLHPSVESVASMPALKVDDFQEQGNALVERLDPSVYARTFFSLVTESDFANPGIERVTEKTAKAFCMGHPTLIVGNARSIRFMEDYGFQVWGDVFDRRADALANPVARFSAVLNDVLRQKSRIDADPAAWLDAVREAGEHNVQHAVSGGFLARFVAQVDSPLVDRLAGRIKA